MTIEPKFDKSLLYLIDLYKEPKTTWATVAKLATFSSMLCGAAQRCIREKVKGVSR